MDKKTKAALAGLAFVAGCEIGIALQLLKMIRNYAIKDSATGETPLDEALEDISIDENLEDMPLVEESEDAQTGSPCSYSAENSAITEGI